MLTKLEKDNKLTKSKKIKSYQMKSEKYTNKYNKLILF